MKRFTTITLLFFSNIILCQNEVKENLVTFNTKERNQKIITFYKNYEIENKSYLLEADNITSKEFVKCKWIKLLSAKDILYFTDLLKYIEPGSKVENNLFTIKHKKNKIIIKVNNSKCTSEHKMYYFQESCKRELTFVILPSEIQDIISALYLSAKNKNLVNK